MKNRDLQNMHRKPLPPTGARRRMELEYPDSVRDWAPAAEDLPACQCRPYDRLVTRDGGVADVVESRDGSSRSL
jgi:hypothetical protein